MLDYGHIMGTFMPRLINLQSWEVSFRNQVKKLATGWSVKERHGKVRLRIRVNGQPEQSESLNFKWNEDDTGNAYARIRNIYALMLDGELTLKQAAELVESDAPKLVEKLN